MPLMSQRAYARHRAEQGLPGTTHRAVQKAVESGRIQLNEKGQIDSDLADRQWAANSSEGHRRNPGQDENAKARAAVGKPMRREPPAPPPGFEFPDEGMPTTAAPGMSFNEASALEKVWKARLAELEYEERSGKLVPAEDVVAKWVELVTLAKTKLLAVPSKIKARLPSLTPADVGIIDQLVREALEELAKGDDEHGEEAAT